MRQTLGRTDGRKDDDSDMGDYEEANAEGRYGRGASNTNLTGTGLSSDSEDGDDLGGVGRGRPTWTVMLCLAGVGLCWGSNQGASVAVVALLFHYVCPFPISYELSGPAGSGLRYRPCSWSCTCLVLVLVLVLSDPSASVCVRQLLPHWAVRCTPRVRYRSTRGKGYVYSTALSTVAIIYVESPSGPRGECGHSLTGYICTDRRVQYLLWITSDFRIFCPSSD